MFSNANIVPGSLFAGRSMMDSGVLPGQHRPAPYFAVDFALVVARLVFLIEPKATWAVL